MFTPWNESLYYTRQFNGNYTFCVRCNFIATLFFAEHIFNTVTQKSSGKFSVDVLEKLPFGQLREGAGGPCPKIFSRQIRGRAGKVHLPDQHDDCAGHKRFGLTSFYRIRMGIRL